MKIAAAYLRVSTEDQDEYSLDSQLKLIREYANKNDYIVPNEYVFVDDGISGRSAAKRGAFQQMIALAKEKDRPFDAILLWKFSRFARNQEESIVYKSMLKKIGVSVVSISEPLPDGPFAPLIERIIEWMDEFYSIRLSGEVKRGMLEKASRGEPVAPPAFGYNTENNKLIPNSYAAVVRSVFKDYSEGIGMASIARRLGNNGIRTSRGNRPDNRFIEYMLNNPVYIGKIRWSKDGRAASSRNYNNENIVLFDGSHEPIIDISLWESVQARLSDDKKKYQRHARKNEQAKWMLKGLVRCSSCGSTLCYQSSACPSMQCYKYAHSQCQTSHALSITKANKAVIAALQEAVKTMSFNIAPVRSEASDALTDTARLIKLEERKLSRVEEAYENGIDSLEEYAKKKQKVQDEIRRLRQQAEAAAPVEAYDPEAYSKKVSAVLDVITCPDVAEDAKNEALRSVLSKIVYNKQAKCLDLFFYS